MALVDAARALFGARGYADVAIDEITESARVTRGALYHHFEDKQALFRAVFEAVNSELAAAIQKRSAGRADPLRRLRASCDAYLDACLRPDVQRIAVLDAPSVLGWRTWCEIDKKFGLGLLVDLIAAAQAAGLLVTQPPEAIAQVLLGALTTGARVVAEAPDPASARLVVGKTIERLLAGLRR